jgi:hypothetical protein
MSYLGVMPSEHSSGDKRRRGPITKHALEQGTIAALRRLPTERHDTERLMRAAFEVATKQRPDALLLTAPDESVEVANRGDLRAAVEEDFDAPHDSAGPPARGRMACWPVQRSSRLDSLAVEAGT